MITAYNPRCIECNEVIYNPICHECLAKEFIEWLSQNKGNKKLIKVGKEIQKFLKQNKKLNKGYSKCISCNRENVFLCPYCFTEYIYKKLKELKVGKKLLGEFITLFNFDLHHEGYYKDFEGIEDFF